MSAKVRVVCVDDARNAVQSITPLLERHGCEVQVCPDGESALAAVEAFRAGVYLVDLTLPGTSGDELAVRLRERVGARPTRRSP